MRTTALSLLLPAALVASAGFAGTPAGVVSDGAGLFTAAERAKIEILGGELLDRQGVTVRVVTLAEAGGRNPKAIATGELRGLDPKSVVLLILVSPQVAHLQPGIDLASSFNEQVSATICSRWLVSPPSGTAFRGRLRSVPRPCRPVPRRPTHRRWRRRSSTPRHGSWGSFWPSFPFTGSLTDCSVASARDAGLV